MPRPRLGMRTGYRTLLIPAAFLIICLFIIPLILVGINSLHTYNQLTGADSTSYSLKNYVDFFTTERFIDVLLRTFKLAALTTVISLAAGYPLAYFIAHQRGWKQVYLLLATVSPLLVFVIVRTVGWTLILGNNGLVNNALESLGIINAPIQILGTETAIIIGLIHVYIPYMILSIYTSVKTLDPRLAMAAESLGASRTAAFLRITFPMTMPGIASGSLLVFTLSMSSFSTPAILGGQRAQVMSYVIYKDIFALQDWPSASSASIILLLSVGAVMMGYLWLTEGRRYRLAFG